MAEGSVEVLVSNNKSTFLKKNQDDKCRMEKDDRLRVEQN